MRRLIVMMVLLLAVACASVWPTNWKSAYDVAFEGARALSALDSAYEHELAKAKENAATVEEKLAALEAVDRRFEPVYDSYETMRKAVTAWLMIVGTEADPALVELAGQKARFAWCEMKQDAESVGLRIPTFEPEPCQ